MTLSSEVCCAGNEVGEGLQDMYGLQAFTPSDRLVVVLRT